MKKPSLLALLLAALLALNACGKNGREAGLSELAPETYYAAEYTDLALPEADLTDLCISGGQVYYALSVAYTEETGGVKQEKYRSELYACALDGSNKRRLPDFERAEIPAGATFDSESIQWLLPGPEGTILAGSLFTYSEPDFENPLVLTNGKEIPNTKFEGGIILRSVSPEGVELCRYTLPESGGIYRMQTDSLGNFYYVDEGETIHAFDRSGKECLRLNGPAYIDSLARLSDGRVAALCADGSNTAVMPIDLAGARFDESLRVPEYYGIQVYPGAFGWDMLVNNGTALYGLNQNGDRGPVLTWLNSDLDGNSVKEIAVSEDGGRIFCLNASLMNGYRDCGVAEIYPSEEAPGQERTVLTLACFDLDRTISERVLRFNRTNTEYRINVKDYSAYNTESARDAGYTRLNAEIVSGKAPDLFCTKDLPVQTYAARGLLEDLWPYIEGDDELGGREALVQPLFQALTVKGKLYQIAPSFLVYTVIGPKETVGNTMGWTFEEFFAAYEKMPEGCDVMNSYMTRDSALTASLCLCVNQFIDWEKGACSFDTEEFRNLIRFSELFPETAEYNGADAYQRIVGGEQMLLYAALFDFSDITMHTDFLGDEAVYVGLPGTGGNGSAFEVQQGLAMSASCQYKDAVWEFMREILDEDYQLDSVGLYVSGFPSNKAAFDKLLEEASTPELDANEKEIPRGGRSVGSGAVHPIYAMTEDQRSAFLALLESTTAMRYWDEAVMEIVFDEVGAYYNGDKTLEQVTANIQKRAKVYVSEQS